MADSKDNKSFFQKVVRFVSNPATDWKDLGKLSPEEPKSDFEKSELRAMIERKQRNDFVRKRELDMLRKVRREGVRGADLADLDDSSRLDDQELRPAAHAVRSDSGVMAKINEIEQAMEQAALGHRSSISPYASPRPLAPQLETQPAPLHLASALTPRSEPGATIAGHITLPPLEMEVLGVMTAAEAPTLDPFQALKPLTDELATFPSSDAQENPITPDDLLPTQPLMESAFLRPEQIQVQEGLHDPALDEAVIAFANADFDTCEDALKALLSPYGERFDQSSTWLVLFDFYRAVGRLEPFEQWALRYCEKFQTSAPQWFSLPHLWSQRQTKQQPVAPAEAHLRVGWLAPPHLDAEAVAKLRSQSLQMPLPWVFDWSRMASIDVEASVLLTELFQHWHPQNLDMLWIAGDYFLDVLTEATPVGAKDIDPAYWLLKLEVLRMLHRPDQFDLCAIDYCITYEVSPPSFSASPCRVRFSDSHSHTTPSKISMVSEVLSTWVESRWSEDLVAAQLQVSRLELSGQLSGDIANTLAKINAEVNEATRVEISCAQLIRVDFIAAGDLLNWVIQRQRENRLIVFTDTHRLVALFFGAMGIDEHAEIRIGKV
jgi:ABC-type transporter Mla MlaB component